MGGLVPSNFEVNTQVKLSNYTLIALGTIAFASIILWRLSK